MRTFATLILIIALGSAPQKSTFHVSSQLIFVNNDRLAGTFVRGSDRSLTWNADFGDSSSEWTVPLANLDVAWLAPPPAETPHFPDRYDWLAERKSDRVLLATGEVLAGDLEGFSPKNELLLKIDGKTLSLPVNVVQAVAFNPALTVRKPPAGPREHVVFASGSRLTLKSLNGSEIVTSFNAKGEVDKADVIAVTSWSDDIVPLSTLKPGKVEETPFGTLSWPWQANRTVKHQPLKLKMDRGVETFDAGIGTHPHCSLTFDLGGKYKTFEALVGLDADTGRKGAVRISILVDAKKEEFALAATDGPKPLRIDVVNAKTLTLITGFGPQGDVQADVNWVNARLVK